MFVALSNGQLALFSRTQPTEDSNQDKSNGSWSLTRPQIFTVADNEFNSTSRLCLVDDEHLWYSFGRNIFVLDITTMRIQTKLIAPANDLSLRFTMQSITIENMKLMDDFPGVWVSFKNSHIIQFYDTRKLKLLIEINLFEAVNSILSKGNEIIRQHKTACLEATSLLILSNYKANCSTLFIGTSAGIILYLDITREQLSFLEQQDGTQIDLNGQIASLTHGHSGQVKFLHSIRMDGNIRSNGYDENNNNDCDMNANLKRYLISGGPGVDIYGPCELQTVHQSSCEEDNMNHLIIWKL